MMTYSHYNAHKNMSQEIILKIFLHKRHHIFFALYLLKEQIVHKATLFEFLWISLKLFYL